MISYPHIDPTFLKIGILEFRWYGLMYSLTFVIGYFVARYLLKHSKRFQALEKSLDIFDLFVYVLLGVIFGGRLGYILFYNLGYYLQNPVSLFAVWEGGMSFHGGLIGVALASMWYSYRKKISLWMLGDLLVCLTPIGLALGRIGNFINAELYGRVTNVAWCMQFPTAIGCRHPSQIYEFLLEGVLLFIILWVLKDRKLPSGVLMWNFFVWYGLFRFIAEFFREPDSHIGLLFSIFTMGQLLSIPLIIIGAIGIILFRKKAI